MDGETIFVVGAISVSLVDGKVVVECGDCENEWTFDVIECATPTAVGHACASDSRGHQT